MPLRFRSTLLAASAALVLLISLPAAAGAAIDVRGSSTPTVNSTASTSIVLTKPAFTAAGDLLIAQFATNGSPGTISAAGWTPLATATAIANPKLYAYYRVAGVADASTYTFSWSNAVANGGSITAYSGVDPTTPFDVDAITATGASSATPTLPGITTLTAGAELVGGVAANSSSVTITPPSGMTEQWEAAGKVNEFASQSLVAAGATGSRTWTISAAREWAGWLAALRPGDAGEPTVSVTAPTSGQSVSGTAVTLNVSATDDSGSVSEVKYYIDGAEVAWDGSGPDWSQSWNSTSVADGSHTIFAKAKDAAGNWGTSETVTFTVAQAPTSNTAPTVSITQPTAGLEVSGGAVALNMTASDPDGVTAVKYYIDGQEVKYDNVGPDWSNTWNSTTVADGTHQIFGKAVDSLGLWGTSPTVSFTVKNGTVTGGDIVIAAVGDMSVSTASQTNATSIKNDTSVQWFFALGDFQYATTGATCTSLLDWAQKGWGPLISKTYHIAGPTHDWYNGNEGGFRTFFNGGCSGSTQKSAAVLGKGSSIGPGEYYSFDKGNWHFAMLPSAIYRSGYGCDTTCQQASESWLDADLANAKSRGKYLAVAYHDPYFTSQSVNSSGSLGHDREEKMLPWVKIMDKYNVRLTLSGSQHNYERSCAVRSDDTLTGETGDGMTAFQVSTGGIGLRSFTSTYPSYLCKRFTGTHGWLRLVLHDNGSFDWQYKATSGTMSNADTGSRPAPPAGS